MGRCEVCLVRMARRCPIPRAITRSAQERSAFDDAGLFLQVLGALDVAGAMRGALPTVRIAGELPNVTNHVVDTETVGLKAPNRGPPQVTIRDNIFACT